MEKEGWEKKKFLIDGFPRNQQNQDGWDEVMGDIADVKFVLFLDSDEKVMLDRIKGRAEEAKKAGQEPRKDDNIETAQKRFKVLNDDIIPLMNKVYEPVKKVKHVNANQTPENVFTDVLKAFDGHL